jgi:hypothetical protein
MMTLSDFAAIQTGLVLARKQSNPTDNCSVQYKQINLRCIKDSGYIDTSELDPYAANETLKTDYLTRNGDIIVRLSNPYTAVLITEETSGFVVSSNFVIIRTDTERLLSEYLFWLLNTEKIKIDIVKNATGSILGTIKPSYFADLNIKPLPIEKQHLVASINLLAHREIQLLEELKTQKEIYYRQLTNKVQKQMRNGK